MRVATVHPTAGELGRELLARLGALRVQLDEREESLARKVRDAHELGVPFVLVIGAREVARREISLRSRARDLRRRGRVERALSRPFGNGRRAVHAGSTTGSSPVDPDAPTLGAASCSWRGPTTGGRHLRAATRPDDR